MTTRSNALPAALALIGAAALVSGVLAITLPAHAQTATAQAPSITLEQATRAIARQGYRVVEIEADDGHWEGEMVKDGQRYDFHADPRTGRLTKIERDND